MSDPKETAHQIYKYIVNSPEFISASEQKPFLAALDGFCGSGKSTVSQHLRNLLNIPLFHADDFFLRPCQRTEARYKEPGGNFDRERFTEELLEPLSQGKSFCVQPYDFHSLTMLSKTFYDPQKAALIEGSYCCHPHLWNFYSLHIFLKTDKETQLKRLLQRSGPERLELFKTKWIPLEENYFNAFHIEQKCELVFET